MKPGRLMVDWASDRPSASVKTMAKSLPSRTKVEKQVRTKAAEASSTTLISRFHRISSSIGSKRSFLVAMTAGWSASSDFIYSNSLIVTETVRSERTVTSEATGTTMVDSRSSRISGPCTV